MLFAIRLLWICLLGVGIGAATTAQAAFQLFDASWTVRSFGNACAKADETPGPHCDSTTSASFEFYSAYAAPQGILCHPGQPRCPSVSTPTDGFGVFSVLGGSAGQPLFCARLSTYGSGTVTRPAKGASAMNPYGGAIPPLYRNPAFFTGAGQPETYSCLGTSTDGFGGPGLVQLGQPITGRWSAITTGTQKGGFNFSAAPSSVPAGITDGIRITDLVGEFGNIYPYLYSYTYATLRNDQGVFGPGQGPGNFNITFGKGGSRYASINVKQGAAKFGGTMKMLGAMTTKVCYWLVAGGGGCSLGEHNWRYEMIGVKAQYSTGGMVTMGATNYTYYALYYNTRKASSSAITAIGSRFPWTTGSVTVTAVGRGPHKTIHYAHGYDNRNTTTYPGLGTIQLVTPVLTRWDGFVFYETGGIGILRIKFLPEPQTWAMLVAGVSLLGVAIRLRGR